MTVKCSEEDLLAAVSEAKEEQRTFLKRLVEINSFTTSKIGVDRVAELMIEELSALGLVHRRFQQEEFGDLHRFDTGPVSDESKGRKGLVLIGHLDTVFPVDSDFQRFEDDGERYLGPGVMDMKGGLSTIVFALRALSSWLDVIPVTVLLNSDEEIGSPVSGPWIREQVRGMAAAMVFEGGRDEDAIITCRRGSGRMNVTTLGKSVHAGIRHQDGINALIQLSHVCVALAGLTDYDRALTVNVGIMNGGIAKNVVPDEASALIDFRYARRQDAVELGDRVAAIKAQTFVEGARTEIEYIVARPPMPRIDENLDLLERYGQVARKLGLASREAPPQGGGSDANLVADEEVPVIDGLGPYGTGFHTTDEWISPESLEKKTQALALFLNSW